jgi:hypothetical protein
MHERYAVVFRTGSAQAAGRLDVERDLLVLNGPTATGELELKIPFSDLREVRVARSPAERLNGYRTLVLQRTNGPPVQVAPLGLAFVPEIVNLLTSLAQRGGDVLAVSVPLKPGCLGRARKLLAKGPPLDPALLGLSEHDVYLREAEVVFVFRGSNVRARVGQATRHPAVWRAGLAWQRCFAAAPQIVDIADLNLDPDPTYRWPEHDQQPVPPPEPGLTSGVIPEH